MPEPKAGEVQIQVMACGICGTDVHIYHGDEGAAPTPAGTVLGHEFSGVVTAVGEGVAEFAVGDRVCVDPNKLCNECDYCKGGIGHFCENMIGIGTTVHGGFAQYVSVPKSQVYKIADTTTFDMAAMTEPVACCLHGIDMCQIQAGDTVAVIGGGNSALQEAVLLSQGCKKVTVVQNLAFLTGESKLAEILNSKDNVEIIYNTVVTELIADGELKAIRVKNTETNEERSLSLDGMFVAIGLVPDTDVAKELINVDERGYILSGEDTLTNVDGIFAAGDCRTKGVRQIATAIADGASAALGACKYIES
jgi:threonine dehydrogenase-like Zn-dependent dehydrogenase